MFVLVRRLRAVCSNRWEVLRYSIASLPRPRPRKR